MSEKIQECIEKELAILRADLEAAIVEAYKEGSIVNWQLLILWLHCFQDRSLQGIADEFGTHVDQVRRQYHNTLEAIACTGLLAGYDGEV